MKKLLLLSIAILISYVAHSQNPLLTEDFDIPANAQLRDHGWTPHSAAATNPIAVGNLPLSMSAVTNYALSGTGRSAQLTNTGSDENKAFSTSVDTGKVYAAFMIKPGGEITTLGSGFFFHFVTYSNTSNPDFTSISTAFRARTFIANGSTPATFRLGLTFNSATVPSSVGTDLTSDLDTSETYLVVVKYEFISGPDNDLVSLYVFENGDDIGSEPATPTLGPYGGTATDATILQGVALRQYNAEQNVIVDGILVRTDWDFEGSTASAPERMASKNIVLYPNPLSGSVLKIKNTNPAPMHIMIFDILGNLIIDSKEIKNEIYIPELKKGVYLVQIEQNGHQMTQKLIKQ